ncbi:MAG TPA: glycosyltransferase family 4 protein [Trichocoleus sp.]
MHVIALENEPSTRRGGQEISLRDVCRGLTQRGHTVTLLYRSPGNLLDEYRSFCQQVMPLRQYRVEMKQPLTSSWQLIDDLRRVPAPPNSLVYSNQYHDSFSGMVLARLKGLPFVCHLRLPPPPALGWQWNLGMRSTRRLIAVSQQTKGEWIKRGFAANRIDVVYNGVSPERFTPATNRQEARSQLSLPADIPLISYVSRLDRDKGLETLIRAFDQAMQQGLTAHLAIAGKPHNQRPEYLDTLKSLVHSLSLANHITFLGHVSQPQQVYQASDLMVLPSEWPEPFARSLLEAMACGIPVLGSRMGGIPELLSGPFSRHLFEAGSVEELASKLQQFIHWREQEPDLGQRCRDHIAQNFNLTKTVDGVEAALLKAL